MGSLQTILTEAAWGHNTIFSAALAWPIAHTRYFANREERERERGELGKCNDFKLIFSTETHRN